MSLFVVSVNSPQSNLPMPMIGYIPTRSTKTRADFQTIIFRSEAPTFRRASGRRMSAYPLVNGAQSNRHDIPMPHRDGVTGARGVNPATNPAATSGGMRPHSEGSSNRWKIVEGTFQTLENATAAKPRSGALSRLCGRSDRTACAFLRAGCYRHRRHVFR